MKKHKGLFICLGVLLILGIVTVVGMKKLLYPDSSKNKYGDRLDGIENVPISDDTIKEMKETFESKESVKSFNYTLSGKIIKVFINVDPETKVEEAKELSDIITKNLSDDQKAFYDILYYVTCEGESETYPLLGSKHKTSTVFTWTVKLEKIEEDEEEKGVENA